MNRSPACRKTSLFLVLAVGSVAAVGTLFHRDAPRALAGPAVRSTDLTEDVNATFGLKASSVFSLAVDAKAGEPRFPRGGVALALGNRGDGAGRRSMGNVG